MERKNSAGSALNEMFRIALELNEERRSAELNLLNTAFRGCTNPNVVKMYTKASSVSHEDQLRFMEGAAGERMLLAYVRNHSEA